MVFYLGGTSAPIKASSPSIVKLRSGGHTTYMGQLDTKAFSHPAPNLSFQEREDFLLGQALFKKLWTSSPSSTKASDGLGPLYNGRSCLQCHVRAGGGHTPDQDKPGDNSLSLFLRLAVPAKSHSQKQQLMTGRLNAIPHPTYGSQLQDISVAGIPAEGRLVVAYKEFEVTLAGPPPTTIILRQPTYTIEDLQYGPLGPELRISPRITPRLVGLGLLELISQKDILANSDPSDKDGDGISGRPNMVWDKRASRLVLGRFGWKGGQPNLDQQIQAAFHGDMGLSTPLFPSHFGDCQPSQADCLHAPHGNSKKYENLEVPSVMTNLVLYYVRHLAVPHSRVTAESQEGFGLFKSLGCDGCHRPHYKTITNNRQEALSNQSIWPFTDMLLHDMGEGLADSLQEGRATGREWRTPPLWGIGKVKQVTGHTHFLHDGRARSIEEAILWHGGEAEASRDAYARLSPNKRKLLLAFINSL